jgi:hypothetical protein
MIFSIGQDNRGCGLEMDLECVVYVCFLGFKEKELSLDVRISPQGWPSQDANVSKTEVATCCAL